MLVLKRIHVVMTLKDVAAGKVEAARRAHDAINMKCPVKPNQKSRPNITVAYEGQVIGFC